MDGERFDGLAKAAANGLSRRWLLAGLVVGGAGLGLHSRSEAQRGHVEPLTEETCTANGGVKVSHYGECHRMLDVPGVGGLNCGTFAYAWFDTCHSPNGAALYMGSGCGPCLW